MADLVESVLAADANAQHAEKPGPAMPDGGNKFQHAISAWRTIDYTNLISNLDNTASEIVAYQRDSTVQRKELAQKTKDFRKLDDATKLSEIKGLLKAYQTFIDLLTNHSKSINSAFLQAYTSLSDAPDPYPLLEASVDSMLVSEDTLPKLTEENQHLQKSVAKLTTQLEETESKLQTESAAKKELESNLESRVKEVEASWVAVLDEKKDNWASKEKTLEEKVENQERLLNEIKASYEVNQRLGKTDDGDQEGQAHVTSAEIEMLHSDLDRTSARLAEIEARNEQLRLELAQAKSSMPSQAPVALEDDPGYMRMRSENSSLIRKLDAARVEKEGLKRDLDSRLRGLEREVGLLKEERDNLKAKVQKWSDYDDVKQELEVLKSIEFSMGDDDDVREATETAAEAKSQGDTLEKLLLARNKKLGDELTILRVSHQDLQTKLSELQEEMSRTNMDLEKSQQLNERLENDLATLQSESSNAFPSGASVAGTFNRYAPSIAPGRRPVGGRVSPTSSIISGINPRTVGEEPMGGGSGILPMITAQRDRFKKRIAQLEGELSESHRTISQLRQEVSALQKDNLNLYEKTRYVSTYNRAGPSASSSSAAYSSNPNPSTVSIGGTGNPGITMDRYRKAYESNISPFAAFRGRESARAYKRMSFPERVVNTITNTNTASVRPHQHQHAFRNSVGANPGIPRPGGAHIPHPQPQLSPADISEYFNMLATKVQALKYLSAEPVCDLTKAKMISPAEDLPPPSAGLTLKHVAIGRGTQNYTCDTSNATAVPVATGAKATLFNASCVAAMYPDLLEKLPSVSMQFNLTDSDDQQRLGPSSLAISGHHIFPTTGVPFFQLATDGVEIGDAWCAKNSSIAAPTMAAKGQQGEGAVPWLKLLTTAGSTGNLQEVYRITTVGGSAPATCQGQPAAFEVQYAAEYWFYQGKAPVKSAAS
uniref:Protein CASP n=1 Tax=Colletotrichum fructicola (strain Nara gc5) TaxID=1213859 RepID=L2FV45_COLFN